MRQVVLSDIFKGNYLRYVTKYKENIQKLLDEYDVVFFMARKAICFYESMVINGEIEKTKCEVYSSRIIDYNIIHKLKDKKIAIVDDVVIKGTSLNRIINIFKEEKINAFVLVVACEKAFTKCLISDNGFQICDSYVTFQKDDIYAFAGLITEYIESSMCSLNIDQPIYSIIGLSKYRLNKLFVDYNAIDISSSIHQSYGIENKVLYFKIRKDINKSSALGILPENTVLKIRLMADGSRITAIPFVLFPQLTSLKLDELYSIISNEFLDDFISVSNILITQENKMKVTSYFFSEILAKVFFGAENINYKKIIDNDIYHFSIDSRELFDEKIAKVELKDEEKCIMSESVLSYSKFAFCYIVGLCYDTIINTPFNTAFRDSNNNIIDEIIITYNSFRHRIETGFDSPELLASSVIDVFIDRGMMVPTIAHVDSGILRAYKMGEYSKLTRSEIEAFAAMLFQYQEMIDSELGKTELEKLCVLFFNTAINRGVFSQQAHYEDDCYSVCYSLFGPRVSSSNTIYNANTDSVLITDFCKKKNGKSIVTIQNGKYIVNPITASGRMARFVIGFAHPYASVSRLFESSEEDKKQNTRWNMYVHTYIQYLTLRAIGNDKRNQYLSLCAELYQLCKLKDDFFKLKSKEKKECEWILKGINSGLWKYWCFKHDALDKTSKQIYEKNPDVGAGLLLDVEPPSDESEKWDKCLNTVAQLLYKAAFLINEVLKAKNSLDYFCAIDDVCENDSGSSSNKTMFTIGSYYAEFKEIRHFYERRIKERSGYANFIQWACDELETIKNEARRQLDLCDQMLENATTKYASIQKLLVVYSSNGNFPINLSEGLNELFFIGINYNKHCKVFGLSKKKSNISDLTDLLERINSDGYDLKYFVLDVGDNNTIDYINNTVKDGRIAHVLNCIMDGFLQRQSHKNPELVLISPKHYAASFSHGNHTFMIGDESSCKVIEDSIKNVAGSNLSGLHMSVTVYAIQNDMHIDGGSKMIINKVGNIENIIEQNGDHSTSTIINGSLSTIPEGMVEFLQKLTDQIDVSEKPKVEVAIESAKEGNTNKFLQTMKLVGSHTLSIIENVASNILYEWLHQQGVL